MLVTQSCPTLCNSMDCSPPGSSVHGIFQARILEWVAIYFSRGSSRTRDQTHISCVSHIADRFLTIWATRETLSQLYSNLKKKEFFNFEASRSIAPKWRGYPFYEMIEDSQSQWNKEIIKVEEENLSTPRLSVRGGKVALAWCWVTYRSFVEGAACQAESHP